MKKILMPLLLVGMVSCIQTIPKQPLPVSVEIINGEDTIKKINPSTVFLPANKYTVFYDKTRNVTMFRVIRDTIHTVKTVVLTNPKYGYHSVKEMLFDEFDSASAAKLYEINKHLDDDLLFDVNGRAYKNYKGRN